MGGGDEWDGSERRIPTRSCHAMSRFIMSVTLLKRCIDNTFTENVVIVTTTRRVEETSYTQPFLPTCYGYLGALSPRGTIMCAQLLLLSQYVKCLPSC